MTDPNPLHFISTREYRRFTEFCDACRRYRYIGLCYGPPGVGKTLSARQYTRWDLVEAYAHYPETRPTPLDAVVGSNTVFYNPRVLNAPKQIERDLQFWRRHLRHICWDDVSRDEEARRTEAHKRDDAQWKTYLYETDWLDNNVKAPPAGKIIQEVALEYSRKRDTTPDPTSLIIVDEADRLKMPTLEQLRAIFDQGGIGLILIGMPGLEKRLARYPQLYSRVGFVHEFRPLSTEDVRQLLHQKWSPPEVSLPADGWADEEALAAIIRITGGNFRLLHRLLTQVARVLEINELAAVTRPVVEAARESLVIGSL